MGLIAKPESTFIEQVVLSDDRFYDDKLIWYKLPADCRYDYAKVICQNGLLTFTGYVTRDLHLQVEPPLVGRKSLITAYGITKEQYEKALK